LWQAKTGSEKLEKCLNAAIPASRMASVTNSFTAFHDYDT
jgi:hypothetical protein